LLYGRDLDWGYAANARGPLVPWDREDLSARLFAELRRSFLFLKQYWEEDVSQILLCGDMPEIRSLTAPLIDRLNVDVETLDTLDAIETASLPPGFAPQVATYRLACSIAAEPPPANLLPAEITEHATRQTVRRVFTGGTAAALALGAIMYVQASRSRADAERQMNSVRTAAAEVRPVAAKASVSSPALAAEGPAMARVLDAVAHAAAENVTVRHVNALRDGGHWNVTVEVVATARDSSAASAATDAFLRRLQQSTMFGEPIRPPVRRTLAGDAGAELVAVYQVRR
jgi:hypothetical protein